MIVWHELRKDGGSDGIGVGFYFRNVTETLLFGVRGRNARTLAPGSERKLRPCVIQRKVTNGYRAMWAAQAEADVRTTVDTARLNGANPFQTILETLA
jgi:hypothetical protein